MTPTHNVKTSMVEGDLYIRVVDLMVVLHSTETRFAEAGIDKSGLVSVRKALEQLKPLPLNV